jgi:predicted Zn-dependent protease
VESPVLSPEELRQLAHQILELTTAETTVVHIDHVATGIARVMRGQVRLNNSGDTLRLSLKSQFGQRVAVNLSFNQIDLASLRQAVNYLERVAREQPGDPVETAMPIPARSYLPNTAWHDTTAVAFSEARHSVIEPLVAPGLAAGLLTAAFVGVALRSTCYADKQGLLAVGQESDSELTVTAWNADGKGSGWAGQASRDWTTLNPQAVAERAVRLTKLAANPLAFEPGRRMAILDRPAVAQIVARMGRPFDGELTLAGRGPLYDREAHRPRLGERIVDARLTLSSDPNDPDGGYLPFTGDAYPLVPMTWIADGGILQHLAYRTFFAASQGVTPANDPPNSLRLMGKVSGRPATVEEMIANCKDGIYVNRFTQLSGIDQDSGAMTGLTNGGCFLIKDGKIEKAVKDFRFIESPWFFLNRLEAVGTSERTAFGYAPWAGSWPIAPTIVPPIMVRDFNFTALAEAV